MQVVEWSDLNDKNETRWKEIIKSAGIVILINEYSSHNVIIPDNLPIELYEI